MTRTLLLIDDDEISREVTALLLAPLGVDALAAADGEAALRMLEDGSVAPDGILLDAQLPGLSGVPLVAALRRVCAAPVLVFSASGISPELAEAVDGFLRKPAEPEAILAAFIAAFEAATDAAPDTALEASGRVKSGICEPVAETKAMANWVIDPAVLRKFRMPAAAVRSMYAALAEDCARRLGLLEAAMRADDVAAVRAEAHAIKGGAAMLGARALRDAAAALEGEEQRMEWSAALAALRAALAALHAVLEDASFDFAASSV